MGTESVDRILRIDKVMDITGLGRSTIYLWVSQGKFPKQRRLGVRAVGWQSSSVFKWIAEREIAI
jgi:prophage regulatory protein